MKMAQFDRGTAQAAALVVAAGENNRFRSEASFVHFCAIVPIPTSSGRTIRHRHNNTGERDANRALHMILILRLPYCKETKNYPERRTTEGLTKKEASRFRKRYIVRQFFHIVRADFSTLELRP